MSGFEKATISDLANDIKKDLKLPKDTQPIGFAVHLPISDEFLGLSKENEMQESRMWVKLPEMAKIHDHQDAIIEARKYGKDACVSLLMESKEQFYNVVVQDQDDLKLFNDDGIPLDIA